MEKRTQSLSTAYKQSGMFKAFSDVLWDLPIEDRQKLRSLYKEARHYHNEIEDLNNAYVKSCLCQLILSDRSQNYDKVRESYDTFGGFMDNKEPAYDSIRHYKEKYEETLVTCSEVACSTLFARLPTLPRELRDEVYTYMWDDKAVNKVQSLWERYSSSYGKEERRSNDKLACPVSRKYCVCNISSDLPIFVRSSYAGDLAAEAISIFFRNLSCLTLHAKNIEEHLGEWFFASGVQARDHIRHLRVKIDTDLLEWELRILDFEPGRLNCPPYKDVTAREDATLKQNLLSLSTIQSGEGFHLELTFSSKIHLTFALLHILEIVKPIFRTLVDKCKFKITIQPTIRDMWRIRENVATQRTSYDRVHSHEYLFTPEDLQAYFDKTPNEWLLMMEEKDAETAERKRIRPEMERLGLIEKHDSDENGL